MKGRDILKSLTEAQKPSKETSSIQKIKPSGSVKALKSELDKIADEAVAGRELIASIKNDGRIIELDPYTVEGASVTDRIPVENDEQFELLKSAISSSGQQVPILVRPNPNDNTRFQAAYGHRRLKVAIELGIKIKAIVIELTDHQMIMAQGQENGPRLDLSFIERALYASKLLTNGYSRELVCLALGVDKPEVSRLLQVANGIDHDLILSIGPARKIGRPRWVALAKILQSKKKLEQARSLVSSDVFKSESDSNIRFESLLKPLMLKKDKKASSDTIKTILKGNSNVKLGWFQETSKGATFSIQNKELSEFLQAKMPQLLLEFEKSSSLKK